MRKRDWADASAEDLWYQRIDGIGDDAPETIVELISTALREAFLMGLEQKQRGIVIDEANNGDRSRYVATARRNGSVGEVAAAKQIITSCRGCKLTWDGQKSKKRDESDG
jgi:hypothetical protein